MTLFQPRAVLFDLDGTLADTAPDLAAALNTMRAKRDLEAAPYEKLRRVASAGARGLIGAAFGLRPDEAGYTALQQEFLENYEAAIAHQTCLFEGIAPLLEELEKRSIQWGIVTNKAARFTDLLVTQIGLGKAGCVISGDTTPHAKPHPAPMLEAARRLDLKPETCWYVGDDLRDIQAGQAAGMATVAAAWGYCGDSGPVTWNADAIAESPMEMISWLGNAGS